MNTKFKIFNQVEINCALYTQGMVERDDEIINLLLPHTLKLGVNDSIVVMQVACELVLSDTKPNEKGIVYSEDAFELNDGKWYVVSLGPRFIANKKYYGVYIREVDFKQANPEVVETDTPPEKLMRLLNEPPKETPKNMYFHIDKEDAAFLNLLEQAVMDVNLYFGTSFIVISVESKKQTYAVDLTIQYTY